MRLWAIHPRMREIRQTRDPRERRGDTRRTTWVKKSRRRRGRKRGLKLRSQLRSRPRRLAQMSDVHAGVSHSGYR